MEIVLGILLAAALVLATPVMAIVAMVRTGDLKRRLDATELRLASSETELALLREAVVRGAPLPSGPATGPGAETAQAPETPVPDWQTAVATDAPPAEPDPMEAATAPARGLVPKVTSQRPLEAIDPLDADAPAAAGAPPEAPPPVPPASGLGGLEEAIGSRWAVWLGALALGLGGIFLVRYSIEQDLIGPGLRIALGALFALVLLAGGEWLRRSDRGLPTLPVADIPSAVTGAGAVVAFGTVYAAHALYGFIGPASAFIALGAVGLCTLVLAGVHGPLLGAIGLIAAFAAPFLVASPEPSPYAFPLYAAVITAACFALAWIRSWSWLAIAATIASVGLGTVSMLALGTTALPSLIQALAGLAAAAVFLVPGIWFGPAHERGSDPLASAVLIGFSLLATIAVMEGRQETAALGLFIVACLAVLGLAARSPGVTAAVPAAGLLSLLVLLSWATGVRPSAPTADLLAIPEPFPEVLARLVTAGTAIALIFGLGSAALAVFRHQRSALNVIVLATTSVLVPIGVLAIAYGKIEGFVVSVRFAALAMVLATSFGAATEAAHRLRSGHRPGLASASAIYAIGSLAALAIALTLLLERAWLTLALALMVAGIAWVYTLRPLPQLRWVAALAGIGVLARVLWDPAINGAGVGETLVFNWLLPGYGLPVLTATAAAILLRRRRGADVPVGILEALAMVFAALLVIVQVRHAFGAHGLRLFAAPMRFPEAATHTVTILAFGIGLSRLAAFRPGLLWQNAVLIVRYGSWAWIVAVMGFAMNPWFTWASVGPHPVINWAFLGYGVGAVLAGIAAWFERQAGRRMEMRVMGLMGLAMLFIYFNITVAMLFRGEVAPDGIGDGELYAYSVVWLVMGIALLLAGARFGSRTLRFASAALVGLAVVKVFLIDMAGLTGLWRALSFIGLGLVLILIGRIYQHALGIGVKRAPPAPPPVEAPGG
ncbi:DUF2339 domain-containing protein [Phreatobacter sp.]|uniref:DUF2339 domain-containing protein n=1 Tax=Phreatobacter sp. TaxID=1966341 RepID=UPI003F714BEE